MSKLWHSRPGAYYPTRSLCAELARLRSNVSLERQNLCQYRSFATYAARLVYPQDRVDEVYEPVTPRKLSIPHPGRLQALPEVTAFLSPFETATQASNVSAEVDVAPIRHIPTSPEISEPYTRVLSTNQTGRGLGDWVVVPNALKSIDWHSPSVEARKRSLLALTLDYTRHIHDSLGKHAAEGSNNDLEPLKLVFSAERQSKLRLRGFDAEDVATWGWILAGETADVACSRLHSITSLATRADGVSTTSDVPYFIFTILLRSPHLRGSSVSLLVNVLTTRMWKDKTAVSRLPDATTAMIILVRLIRHARRVVPSQLPAIAELSETLLKVEYASNPDSSEIVQRLCKNYNRLLAFFSIPTSQHPFRSISIQQQAQFKILRQMVSMEPALAVTREGYQALAKVQLAHKKTDGEQAWARTKAESWPPWREDKLGITEDVDYPGSQSRAADVLRRQVETGYMQTSWDKSAKILAGWDTDKSPTIQSRTLLPKAPLTWLQSLVRSLTSSDRDEQLQPMGDAEVWAARIRATRSVREAWACFCAYDKASSLEGRSQEPYHAMFEKLARRLQPTDPGIMHLPGDGKEINPQPAHSRVHLYVPSEPPSFYSFYEKMQRDGVKFAGRLLVLLLDQARTTGEGVRYLSTSRKSEINKDVMLNAHKYHPEFIRSQLKYVKPVVFASFMSMLWRTRKGSGRLWYRPTSQAARPQTGSSRYIEPTPISSREYVLDLLRTVKLPTQVCNKVLETIVRDLAGKNNLIALNDGWAAIQAIIGCMEAFGTATDMATFYNVASVIDYLTDTKPDFHFEIRCPPEQDEQLGIYQVRDGHQLAQTLFVEALVGSNQFSIFLKAVATDHPNWLPPNSSTIVDVPSPAALHLLMRLLAKTGNARDVLTLIQWMDQYASQLNAVSKQLANGDRQMRFALCVAAMAMEENDSKRPGGVEDLLIARKLVERNKAWGGWPGDDELRRYLGYAKPSSRPKE